MDAAPETPQAGRARPATLWIAPCVAVVLAAALGGWVLWAITRPQGGDGQEARPATIRDVTVSVEPAGAWVWIDGTYRGKAPLTLPVSVREAHQVRVTQPGYVDWETEVPRGTSDLRLDVRLTALRKGRLSLRVYPPGAAVHLEGRPAGQAPLDIEVVAGKHTVRAESPDHVAEERVIEVGADALTSLRWVLRHADLARLQREVRRRPADPAGRARLAEGRLTHGQVADALKSLRVALGLVASQRETAHVRSLVLDRLPRLYLDPPIPEASPEAVADLQRRLDQLFRDVVREYPDPGVLRAIVGVLASAGKHPLAERLAEAVMAVRPTAVEPYLCLAELYAHRKRYGDAEAILVLCQAVRAPSKDACFALALAWAELTPHAPKAGDRARAELQRALNGCLSDDERQRLESDFRQLTRYDW